MANIKFILRNKPTKEGLYPVVLRLTKDRKSKIISLNFNCNNTDWDEKTAQFKKSYSNYSQANLVLTKIRERALKIIMDFKLNDVDFTLEQFEEKFRGKEASKITVFEFFDDLVSDLLKSGKAGNAKAIKETKQSFFSFCKREKILFKEITPAVLDKYEVYLRQNGNSDGGVAFKMRELRAVFNKAIKNGIVEEKYYPFTTYKISKLKNSSIKKAITREQIKLIENFDVEAYPKLADAKRYFLFSYFTGGMNFYDMMLLKWSNLSGDRLQYVRSKTKGKFNLSINPMVKEILDFYKAQNRNSVYVFPILLKEDLTPVQVQNRKHKQLKKFNKDLKKISQLLNINKPISSYVARHSFATNLKHRGDVSTDVISQAMGHKNVAITMSYLKEFDNEVIDDAISKLVQDNPIQRFAS